MKHFMGRNFLLSTETARALYHRYAEQLPIIDYHCHVSPKEIAEDRRYANITELWLGGDHYKWRAMRSCGVPEKYITGDASDYDKFKAYARCMPSLIGNPLYHWTHLELRRYFDTDLLLTEDTADEIWGLTAERLADPSMSVRNLIRYSRVKLLCTTDDPADPLDWHRKIAADESFSTAVLPAFRPDKSFNINQPGLGVYYDRLGDAAGVKITDPDSLKEALCRRMDVFDSLGCRTADHGLDEFPAFVPPNPHAVGEAMKAALDSDGRGVTPEMLSLFKADLLTFLAGEYRRRGWVMQLHMGVWRNANTVMRRALGPDTGFDVIGKMETTDLIRLLDWMESRDSLPRTVLYSVDPSANAALGTLLGAFQTEGDGFPKVMQGSAWWFNDTLEGMRRQMTSLANLSAFGKFVGMLTDSRSFTSYARHEYFRRILCDLVGGWVEDGLYPFDPEALAILICDICFNNTKNFFRFHIPD